MKYNYQNYIASSRRLAVLRILAESPSHTLNTQVLRDALESIGYAAGLNAANADAQWLSDEKLVKLKHVENFIVIRATQRGLDVSSGRLKHQGVRTPYLDTEQWDEENS